jgi:serine/threonine-protein kinase
MRVSSHLQPSVELLAEKYEVLELLGGGGMGYVFRARHKRIKRLVAIKLLQNDLDDADALARFLREARAIARIQSGHVVQVLDADVLSNGRPYIVMEYLHGRDLAAWLAAAGRLPVQLAVDFTLQALEALAEAHSLRIIHRDIKPANLFATNTQDGTIIKVLDFGLAKSDLTLDTLESVTTERGTVIGTPSYMSPEQFLNATEADVRSDVWAIGATLFELLTGTPPFAGMSLPEVYRAVMHRAIPGVRSLVPELPRELENVVATCLTRERELRYGDMAELAHALREWGGADATTRAARVRAILERNKGPALPTDAASLHRSRSPERAWSVTLVATPQAPSRHGRRALLGSAGLIAVISVIIVISAILHTAPPPQHPARATKLPPRVESSVSSAKLESHEVTAGIPSPNADADGPPIAASDAGLKLDVRAPAGRNTKPRPKSRVSQKANETSIYEEYP